MIQIMRKAQAYRQERSKSLLILLFSILVLVFSICGMKNAREYPDTPVFFEHDEQVWQYEPKTEAIKKISEGIYPAVSPDRTKVAYIIQQSRIVHKIMIYDTKTGKSQVLSSGKKGLERVPPWECDWSPDGKYLLIDFGTGPQRIKSVIESSTGKEVLTFSTIDCAWICNDRIVYSDLQEI